MAKKRTRLVYMPKSRRKPSKSGKVSSTNTSVVVDQSCEGHKNDTAEQPKTAFENVLSPEKSKSKVKRTKRRSGSIVYRPQSRRNRTSQNRSENSLSTQLCRKLDQSNKSVDPIFDSCQSSGAKKDKKRTQGQNNDVQDATYTNSEQHGDTPFSRKSNDVNSTLESVEDTSSAPPKAVGERKKIKRKSASLVFKPQNSFKKSKQNKKKILVNNESENEGESVNSSSKIEKNLKSAHKRRNASDDSVNNSDTSTKENNSLVGNKPPRKKRKKTCQTEDISIADQAKTTDASLERAKQKNQREQVPEKIKDMSITRKAFARWKPLSTSTKNHVKEIMDSSILSVMNMVGSRRNSKEEVHEHLEILKKRVLTRLECTKGPTHVGDYSKMESQLEILEDCILSNNSQMEALDKEVAEQNRLLKEEQEQYQNLISVGNKSVGSAGPDNRIKICGLLLEEPINTLNLPQLPKESLEGPLPKLPSEIKQLSTYLSQSVLNIVENGNTLELPQWLKYLSQIADNLPGQRD